MLIAATLEQQLRQLYLPTFAKQYLALAQHCEQQKQTSLDYLSLLTQQELGGASKELIDIKLPCQTRTG